VALLGWIRRGRGDLLNAAVGAALVALALQNLVDFNLEILGVALPAAVLAGFLSAGATSRGRSSRRRRRRPVMTVPLLALVGLLVVYTGATAARLPPTSRQDGQRLRGLALRERPAEQILEAARQVIWRHPADYFPHLLGGQQLLLQRKPEALAWLNRALILYPKNPVIHLQAAEAMLRFGRQKQALLEFRLAIQHGAHLRTVLHRALLACKDTKDMRTLVPDNSEYWITAIYVLVQQNRLELALKAARLARWWWYKNEDLMVAEIAALYKAAPIKALLAAQQMVAKYPQNYLGHLWLAAALEQVGPPGASIQVLHDARLRFPTEVKFEFRLVMAYLGCHRINDALALAKKLMKRVDTPLQIARVHRMMARIYDADGRQHLARFEAEEARKILKPR
jgi:tetratricopeptide (TPR) repeat protein